MTTAVPLARETEADSGDGKAKPYPNISIPTEDSGLCKTGLTISGIKRQRDTSPQYDERASKHVHQGTKSCLDPSSTNTSTERTGTFPSADPSVSAVVDLQLEMSELGIQFNPSRICPKHKNTEDFNSALESAITGQRALKAVEDLIQRALAQPGWPAKLYFPWSLGYWVELCCAGDGIVDWIDYFERQCRHATKRYKCDLSNSGGCIMCWLQGTPHYIRPLMVLAGSILNDTTPDVSDFSDEEGILIREALACHRGEELSSESDGEDDSDSDGYQSVYDSGYESA